MMGRQNNDQGPLFYEFRLDEAVPDDHLVRKIDSDVDQFIAAFKPGAMKAKDSRLSSADASRNVGIMRSALRKSVASFGGK